MDHMVINVMVIDLDYWECLDWSYLRRIGGV